MNLNECIIGRRSIREFLDKPVSKEDIEAIIKAAQMAPSWKNSQVSRYYAVTTPETKAKLISCLSDFNKENAKNAPVLIVSTVVNGRSGFERDGSYTTHLKDGFQYFDNGLQVQNLCLKAYDLGLSTLIMGIYDNEQIRSLLEIPDEQIVVSVIALGYSNAKPEAPKRKPLEDILYFK